MATRKAPKQKRKAPKQKADEHEYTFDVKFFASISVKGTSVKDARKQLDNLLDQASLDLGKVDGKALTVGVDVDGEKELMEIDGEDAYDQN